MRAKRGFTLIELVIVIAVLGILAGIAVPRFLHATAAARGAKVIANLRSIDSAANIYMTKHGRVPTLTELTAVGDAQALAIEDGYHGGNFIVVTNDGSEKEYTDQGDYGVNEDGRGYLTTRAHTVTYYLSGGVIGSDLSPADVIDMVTFAKKYNVELDSGAAYLGKNTEAYLADLKKAGIDLEAMGVTSWSYTKKDGGALRWTTQDIASGKVVTVQYKVSSGNYTVWTNTTFTTKNASQVDPSATGTYKVLNFNGKHINTNQADQTYEKAMEIYHNLIGD